MSLDLRVLAIVVFSIAAICIVALMGNYVFPPEIPPDPRAFPGTYSGDEVRRGEQVASVGDCIVCHTTSGGTAFSGGRALPTPFGTLYSSNITPDPATGIGTWSFKAFARAMQDGVNRKGQQLYPAFPYNHFALVSDEDLKALYAFLMTRQPVEAVPPPNDLMVPLGFRPVLAGWKLLFFHHQPFQSASDETTEWNRGKYLVEGLGHCGGCHTPRNLLGAEEAGKDLAGGVAEGYIAPPLDGSSPFSESWTEDQLFHYLKTGEGTTHGAAAGPMGAVTEGLSRLKDEDVRAIAVYIASRMKAGRSELPKQLINTSSTTNGAQAIAAEDRGSALFQGACAGCHSDGSPMRRQGRASLATVTALNASDPRNAIQAVLQGVRPPVSAAGPYMPGFADNLTDKDIADLLAYARTSFTGRTPWAGLTAEIAKIRQENQTQ